jgi:hypothetical protein
MVVTVASTVEKMNTEVAVKIIVGNGLDTVGHGVG